MTFLKSYRHQSEKSIIEIVRTPFGSITLMVHAGRLIGIWPAQQNATRKIKIDIEKYKKTKQGGIFSSAKAKPSRVDLSVLEKAKKELSEYFSGRRKKWSLPLKMLQGTPFQKKVWAELQKIPYGQTISYGDLAKRVGRPLASRAVGMACSQNAHFIVVPCHRVIASSGKPGGFALGLKAKQTLLEFENKNI